MNLPLLSQFTPYFLWFINKKEKLNMIGGISPIQLPHHYIKTKHLINCYSMLTLYSLNSITTPDCRSAQRKSRKDFNFVSLRTNLKWWLSFMFIIILILITYNLPHSSQSSIKRSNGKIVTSVFWKLIQFRLTPLALGLAKWFSAHSHININGGILSNMNVHTTKISKGHITG
jgi:hypothetical protein